MTYRSFFIFSSHWQKWASIDEWQYSMLYDFYMTVQCFRFSEMFSRCVVQQKVKWECCNGRARSHPAGCLIRHITWCITKGMCESRSVNCRHHTLNSLTLLLRCLKPDSFTDSFLQAADWPFWPCAPNCAVKNSFSFVY